MKEKNLLASAALFSELYNDESYQNIFDIIALFIKGAIIHDKKYSFNSTEITALLEKIYEFQIPESVIRTTLNNKLKEEFERKDGYYHYINNIHDEQNINEDHNAIVEDQNKLFSGLINFVETKENKKLSDSEKTELFENFAHFLFDNGFSDKFSNHVSAYIISNENNQDFTKNLNIIREGIILYQGVKFTADINELGKWTTDLTLYLNTEHLFNAVGYNGVLYQEIFNDFITLVYEINSSNSTKSQSPTPRRKIELRYFEETKKEVDYFFLSAESIIKGQNKLDPSRAAMKMILENCTSPSDIKAKRIKFDLELGSKGIHLQEFNVELSKLAPFNVEDQKNTEELRKKSHEKGRDFDEHLASQYFKIFTKINCFRNGESNKPFERIGHIFVTDNGFAKFLAHNNLVKFDDDAISFAKDIDFIITRFWFKLKKGFSKKQTLPKSFDVVTKARILLSSHINQSLSIGYQRLVDETSSGQLSQEEALYRSYEFREKPRRPEDITIDNIDDSLDFLTNDSYFENIYREREKKDTLLLDFQKRTEELEKEIKKRDQLAQEKENTIALLNYLNTHLKIRKRSDFKDFGLLLSVFSLNLSLALFAVIVSVSSKLKEWLALFGFYQISIIAIYVIVIVIEVMGRSYLFNKERLKKGWNWITVIISLNYSNYQKNISKELEIKYLSTVE